MLPGTRSSRPAMCWVQLSSQKLTAAMMHQQRRAAAMARHLTMTFLKSVSTKPKKSRVGVIIDKPSPAGGIEGHLEIAMGAAGPCRAHTHTRSYARPRSEYLEVESDTVARLLQSSGFVIEL